MKNTSSIHGGHSCLVFKIKLKSILDHKQIVSLANQNEFNEI